MGFRQIIVLGLGFQVAAMPIVEPLLPTPSLPFRTPTSTAENEHSPAKAPSKAGGAKNDDLGDIHGVSYHYIGPRGTTSNWKIPMLPNMNKDDALLWKTLSEHPLPIKPNDEFIFYTGLGLYPKKVIDAFAAAHKNSSDPSKTFWSKQSCYDDIPECKIWYDALDTWTENTGYDPKSKPWKGQFIVDMKLAELAANHEQPVNVIYGDSIPQNVTFPPHRLFTTLQAGILTSPESKIPRLLRWEASAYESAGLKKRTDGGWIEHQAWRHGEAAGHHLCCAESELDFTWYEPVDEFAPGHIHPGSGPTRSDFEHQEARQRAYREVRQLTKQMKASGLDVAKVFDSSADALLRAVADLRIYGKLSPEAEAAVSSMSAHNTVHDPVWTRLIWEYEQLGVYDEELSDFTIEVDSQRWTENGNIPEEHSFMRRPGNTHDPRLSCELFKATPFSTALIAKGQIAAIAVAGLLMAPEEFEAQAPAAMQIANLASQPGVFNALDVFAESGYAPGFMGPKPDFTWVSPGNPGKPGDQASLLANIVRIGMQNTDWYADSPNEVQRIMRHTELAVKIRPKRYETIVNQKRVPKESQLMEQTEAIEAAVQKYRPENFPVRTNPQPPTMQELKKMSLGDILRNNKGKTALAVLALVGVAVAGIVGGIFRNRKKHFDLKKQKLTDCKGDDCKSVSDHEYKDLDKKQPQQFQGQSTIVKSVTSTVKTVTSVTSSATHVTTQSPKSTSASSKSSTSATSSLSSASATSTPVKSTYPVVPVPPIGGNFSLGNLTRGNSSWANFSSGNFSSWNCSSGNFSLGNFSAGSFLCLNFSSFNLTRHLPSPIRLPVSAIA